MFSGFHNLPKEVTAGDPLFWDLTERHGQCLWGRNSDRRRLIVTGQRTDTWLEGEKRTGTLLGGCVSWATHFRNPPSMSKRLETWSTG